MDVLLLSYRGEALREFELREHALEVGRAAGCDIVVHDPGVRERHALVLSRGGTVLVHDLETGGRARPFGTGEELPLGYNHSLLRLPGVPTRPHRVACTEPLQRSRPPVRTDLSLVLGKGSDARRVPVGGRPLTIGSSSECDLVLGDRTVSSRHCRLEPSEAGIRVRDLGSRNGTFIDGVVVNLAQLLPGSVLRVGRSDLRLVRRDPARRARRGFVVESAEMQEVMEQVSRLARHRWPTLVTGESGTGKEGVARAIHDRSSHADGPFVAINAGGLPASLVESELFGHEKGAFTGASGSHRGVFEQADGGTLFLDEVGELSLELQARLLRVLETWEVRRVGAEGGIPVNVRVVAATHRDLRAMVAAGSFRQDLYFRLAVLGVHVPPLRERPGDLRALSEHFLGEVAREVGPKRFSEDALARLLVHQWPGNVRELRNLVRRVAVGCVGPLVEREEVERILEEMGVVQEIDRDRLRQVVSGHGGNLAAAARALGIPRTTLRDRLKLKKRT